MPLTQVIYKTFYEFHYIRHVANAKVQPSTGCKPISLTNIRLHFWGRAVHFPLNEDYH